jgi:Toastrack DUF4097
MTATATPTTAPPAASNRNFRTLWVVLGSIFVIASVGWGAVQAGSLLAFDRERFRMAFTALEGSTITMVDIDNDAGSVRVIGSDDAEGVTVDGKIIRGFTRPKHDERVAGGTVELDARCDASLSGLCSLDYVVSVPRDVTVKVRASGGGIRVFGVDGPLDLSSSGGGVHVERATGDLTLRSSGGGVTATQLESARVDAQASGGGVRLEFDDEPRSVTASSSGGGVTVVVPRTDADYRIDASSSDGGFDTEVTRNDNSNRSITVHSSGGGVTVRYPTT